MDSWLRIRDRHPYIQTEKYTQTTRRIQPNTSILARYKRYTTVKQIDRHAYRQTVYSVPGIKDSHAYKQTYRNGARACVCVHSKNYYVRA